MIKLLMWLVGVPLVVFVLVMSSHGRVHPPPAWDTVGSPATGREHADLMQLRRVQ